MLFDVAVLELRAIRFDETFGPGKLNFSGSEWEQSDDLHTVGNAELLDPAGSRTIRVRGTVRGTMQSTCARCLETVSTRLDGKLDLFYYPMSVIARKEEVAIGRNQTDVGFYEDPGPTLPGVLQEQVMLWLPMRSLCGDECRGICTQCGKNLNKGTCDCAPVTTDARWDSLRNLQLKTGP